MYRSLSTDHIQEVARTHVQGDLDFEHVGFLLTAAPLSLFFWGRSIGTSVASTSITTASFTFVPDGMLGSASNPLWIRRSSTRRTIRHALVSLIPYYAPRVNNDG
jgi:hypothetical protein